MDNLILAYPATLYSIVCFITIAAEPHLRVVSCDDCLNSFLLGHGRCTPRIDAVGMANSRIALVNPVGDDAETDPALHSGIAAIAAAIQAMPALADADASLASSEPLLAVAKPSLLLLAVAGGTLGGGIGNADMCHTVGFAAAPRLPINI